MTKQYGGWLLLTKVIVGTGFVSLLVLRVFSVESNILTGVGLGRSFKESITTNAKNATWSSPSVDTEMMRLESVEHGDHKMSLINAPAKQPTIIRRRHMANASVTSLSPGAKRNVNVSALSPSGVQVTFSKYRYYIYQEEAITRKKFFASYRKANLEPNDPQLDHAVTDARSEDALLSALENHPWRTDDPTKADFFIVPTPIATLLAAGGGRNKSTFFDETFGNLTSQALFQQNSHRHIILSLHWVAFNAYPLYANTFARALSRNYAKLANVTIATHMDAPVIRRYFRYARKKNFTLGVFRGYHGIFANFRQATCCSFSLGLWASDVPLIPASYETWKQKSTSIFYHTRETRSGSGSTPYRHGPLNLTAESLPANASIGLDIPPAQWLNEFTQSKFCVAVRGDTPHSHSLLRAVRVGCIPVVVADFYPIFAPTLRSTLNMEDFCILIKEKMWQNNVGKQLGDLLTLDEMYLRNKTKHLAWAQRVIFPDSFDSLFVPAFFKESEKVALKPVR